MRDFGRSDKHQDAGGQSEIAPFILTEDTEGLGDGFEDALSANLDRVLYALRIAAGDLAGADGHDYHFRVLFCSPLTLRWRIAITILKAIKVVGRNRSR
jgi:hypothetical protein